MKLAPAHHVRPISAQAILFGTAAALTAILISTAIVEQNVLALAALTAVALAIVWPVEVSLGLFAALVPFDQALVLGNSKTTITWLAGAFGGVTLLVYGLVSGRFRCPPREGLYWGLFVLWSAASTVWAIDPATSLKWLPTVATLFALYIVAISLRVTRQELSRIVLLAVAAGVVAASVSIFEFANHMSPAGRASLIVGKRETGPNALPFSLLLPFSFAVGGVLSERSLLKCTALVAALASMTVSIFLAMSRGALIALSATVLVWLFRAGVRRRILIPILVLAIPLFFLPNLFYQRLEEGRTNRGTGRYDIWLVFFIAAIWSQMRAARRALSSHGPCNYFGIAIEAACWGQLVVGLSGDTTWTKPFWLAFALLALISQERAQLALNELPWVPPNQPSYEPEHRRSIRVK